MMIHRHALAGVPREQLPPLPPDRSVWYDRAALFYLNREFLQIPAKYIKDSYMSGLGTIEDAYRWLSEVQPGTETFQPVTTAKVTSLPERYWLAEKDWARAEKEFRQIKLVFDEKKAKAEKQAAEELNTAQAIKDGLMTECITCFDDVPLNRTIVCNAETEHKICFSCGERLVNEEIGKVRCRPKCPDLGDCPAAFSENQLKLCLPQKTFDRLLRLQFLEDVNAAGLEGLEECPFCDYVAVIVESFEDEPNFHCAVEECKKVSCRKCKREAHHPRTCEQAQADNKLNSRHELENAMSEALKRECNKCKTAFVKEDGCNKMTCTKCGTYQCYVCKKTITGYEHFSSRPGGCAQDDGERTVQQRHDADVKKAEAAVRAKILAENSEVTAEDLDEIHKVSDVVKDDEEAARQGPYRAMQAARRGVRLGPVDGLIPADLDFAQQLQADFLMPGEFGRIFGAGAVNIPEQLRAQQQLVAEQWVGLQAIMANDPAQANRAAAIPRPPRNFGAGRHIYAPEFEIVAAQFLAQEEEIIAAPEDELIDMEWQVQETHEPVAPQIIRENPGSLHLLHGPQPFDWEAFHRTQTMGWVTRTARHQVAPNLFANPPVPLPRPVRNAYPQDARRRAQAARQANTDAAQMQPTPLVRAPNRAFPPGPPPAITPAENNLNQRHARLPRNRSPRARRCNPPIRAPNSGFNDVFTEADFMDTTAENLGRRNNRAASPAPANPQNVTYQQVQNNFFGDVRRAPDNIPQHGAEFARIPPRPKLRVDAGGIQHDPNYYDPFVLERGVDFEAENRRRFPDENARRPRSPSPMRMYRDISPRPYLPWGIEPAGERVVIGREEAEREHWQERYRLGFPNERREDAEERRITDEFRRGIAQDMMRYHVHPEAQVFRDAGLPPKQEEEPNARHHHRNGRRDLQNRNNRQELETEAATVPAGLVRQPQTPKQKDNNGKRERPTSNAGPNIRNQNDKRAKPNTPEKAPKQEQQTREKGKQSITPDRVQRQQPQGNLQSRDKGKQPVTPDQARAQGQQPRENQHPHSQDKGKGPATPSPQDRRPSDNKHSRDKGKQPATPGLSSTSNPPMSKSRQRYLKNRPWIKNKYTVTGTGTEDAPITLDSSDVDDSPASSFSHLSISDGSNPSGRSGERPGSLTSSEKVDGPSDALLDTFEPEASSSARKSSFTPRNRQKVQSMRDMPLISDPVEDEPMLDAEWEEYKPEDYGAEGRGVEGHGGKRGLDGESLPNFETIFKQGRRLDKWEANRIELENKILFWG